MDCQAKTDVLRKAAAFLIPDLPGHVKVPATSHVSLNILSTWLKSQT